MTVYQIAYHTESRGRQPVAEWLDGLDKKTRDYLQDKISLLKQHGLLLLKTNMMRVIKGYGGGFYELKYDKYRIALYHEQTSNTFILLHGFKKERMRETQEIKTAHSRLREYQTRR